ncbi:Fis family transcriptional regulator, factor for inversion stimulation protein [Gammaproteobacteria bacterium]
MLEIAMHHNPEAAPSAIVSPVALGPIAGNTLRECTCRALERYFQHLDGHPTTNLYDLVMGEVEAPLLEVVMAYVQGNQSRAAEMLGISRGTLRKKLAQYGRSG